MFEEQHRAEKRAHVYTRGEKPRNQNKPEKIILLFRIAGTVFPALPHERVHVLCFYTRFDSHLREEEPGKRIPERGGKYSMEQ